MSRHRVRPRANPADLAAHSFDVIVIGAGINGIAIARDAAMRGLSVLCVDKGDLAGGTTSWSTRLIHGGLRYLEHAEIGLVRESLRERERLLRNAPHLVKPLPLILPVYEGAKRGPMLIRAGMLLYDALSFDKSLPRHRMLSPRETVRRIPGIEQRGLRAGAMYYDAQATFPERLAVENALSALEHGAIVLTYTRVDRLKVEGQVVRGVELTDLVTGEAFTALGKYVINVSGPWVDDVLATAPADLVGARFMGGTKGSHLVVDSFPGAPVDALYYEAVEDGRAIFIVPWNGGYLIGSTDIRYDGDLDDVRTDQAEIGYLLKETNRLIPTARLTPDDVLWTYAGIRPLPYQPAGAEGAITRKHILHNHAPRLRGLYSVIGGKLTTYRSLAEEMVDELVDLLGKGGPCRTAQVPLPGAAGIVPETARKQLVAESPLSAETTGRLFDLYGARAADVLALVAEGPALAECFDPETGAIAAEVVFAVRAELAETLADILLRRTMVGLAPHVGVGPDEAAARIAAQHLGWSGERAAREVAAYRRFIARYTPRTLRTGRITYPESA